MPATDNAILKVAQNIKKRIMLLTFLVFLISSASYLLPREQPYFFSFEHKYADLRTTYLSKSLKKPYDKLVIVKITERDLEDMVYRSPIDRSWLADLIGKIDSQKPSVIALDILIDQATEPHKDQLLIDTIKNAQSPIILASADSRFDMTAKQRSYNKSFISKSGALSGFVNAPADPDDIVRTMPIAKDKAYPESFSDIAVKSVTGKQPPIALFNERISWLKKLDHKTSVFSEPLAHYVKFSPDSVGITGKLVLIGADLPDVDKHKTPFANEGRINKGESGVRILAQMIAQKLDGRRVTILPPVFEFTLYLLSALIGFLIAASKRLSANKARIFSYVSLLTITIDLVSFTLFSILLPTAMILFTMGFAVGLPTMYIKSKKTLCWFRNKWSKT